MSGFYKSQGDTIGRDFRLNNDVTVSVRFQKPWRFPNAAEPKDALGRSREQSSYGLFIQTGENEFIIAGINLAVTAKSSNTSKEIWLKDAWEGTYENRIWKPIVLHNGDEAGFLRGGDPEYRIGAYHVNPPEPAIFHFKVVINDR
jgi:hypothetical protein